MSAQSADPTPVMRGRLRLGLADPERLSQTIKTATLPRRTAGRSSCPDPDRPVPTLDDVNLLLLVLDGLHHLDSEGAGR